jgi:hypothetical protein
MQLYEEPFCYVATRNAAQVTEEKFTAQDDLPWLRS